MTDTKELTTSSKGAKINDSPATTSQSGSPHEGVEKHSKIRPGQIDWVTALERPADFKSWLFRFRIGSKMYLSEKVYPDEDERRFAWLNALLRAATLGKNEEMIRLLELYDNGGTTCEELLVNLEKRFMPEEEMERKRTTLAFMAFNRGKRTLTNAVKELKIVLLDCERYGFSPDDATRRAKYESLLLSSELPFFTLYLNADKSQLSIATNRESETEKVIRVLEKYGRDQDGIRSVDNGNGPTFAGSSFSDNRKGSKEKKPKRKGFATFANGREENPNRNTPPCKKCGRVCAAVKGTGACPAQDRTCNKCGKIGHFEKQCYSTITRKGPRTDAKAKAGVSVAAMKEDAQKQGDSF